MMTEILEHSIPFHFIFVIPSLHPQVCNLFFYPIPVTKSTYLYHFPYIFSLMYIYSVHTYFYNPSTSHRRTIFFPTVDPPMPASSQPHPIHILAGQPNHYLFKSPPNSGLMQRATTNVTRKTGQAQLARSQGWPYDGWRECQIVHQQSWSVIPSRPTHILASHRSKMKQSSECVCVSSRVHKYIMIACAYFVECRCPRVDYAREFVPLNTTVGE